MTVIVEGCKTKKELKEKAAAFNRGAILGLPFMPAFVDPSLHQPLNGGSPFGFNIEQEVEFICTNHPKRSWFAAVRISKGKVEVK